jgi:hypothetical protein
MNVAARRWASPRYVVLTQSGRDGLQQDAQPMIMRLRLVRHVWAICAACGAEYDYDAGARTFHRVGGSGMPDDAAKVGAP